MIRKLTLISCILWIAGLTVSIVGLNLEGDVGTWMSVCGNIAFLVGLGLQGVIWLRKQREARQQAAASAGSGDPEPPEGA